MTTMVKNGGSGMFLICKGELSLDFSFFTTTRYEVFILCYEYPTSPTKGMKRWAYENKKKGTKGK
jgi:hypothetical protein